MFNVHNFRIKVNTWALLVVVLVSTGLAAMGDLSTYGLPPLVSIFLSKALPAMLTVCAAVFYTPDNLNGTVSVNTTTKPVPASAPVPTPPPVTPPAPSAAPEAAA